MSESITHTSVVDDCCRLVQACDDICDDFKTIFSERIELARLGGITRHGDRHNPQLLSKFRELKKAGKLDENEQRKLAFVLGWMSHRAADRVFKRIFRMVDNESGKKPRDCSVYHDAYLFREHYNSGARNPYQEGILEPIPGSYGDLESLLDGMWQRMLVKMHTFIPDDDDIELWLENVMSRYQRLYVDLQRYVDAVNNPDPDMTRRFINEINFYDRNDPLIQNLIALRNGDDLPHDLDTALEEARDGCKYGLAVGLAFSYIRAASAYYEFEIDDDELRKRLHIGVAELDKVV